MKTWVLQAALYFGYALTSYRLFAQSAPVPLAAPSRSAQTPAGQAKQTRHTWYGLTRVKDPSAADGRGVWQMQTKPMFGMVGPDAPQESFTSLADPTLREWVSRLPAGTVIQCSFWTGPFRHHGDDKLVSTEVQSQMDGFEQFCRSKNVNLLIVLEAG